MKTAVLNPAGIKILIASINFAPNHAGIGVYSTDFAVYTAEQDWNVSMVTGFPYYPQWKKRSEDEGRIFHQECYKNVKVYRGYLYVPRKVSNIARLWHEFTFCFFASLNFIKAGRPDVIVLFTPPFFLGCVGIFFSVLWRRPCVINIQDLPLDAATALGMVRRSWAIRLMQKLEEWTYKRASLVVTLSEGMLDTVRSKGVAIDKSMLVPNWIDVAEGGRKVTKGAFLRNQPQASGKFTVAYAGNIGVKQGIDLLLLLAKQTRHETGIHYFIIGDGAAKPQLTASAAELQLSNITFLPFMEMMDYYAMLADVDMVFVAQRSGAGNNFFPSKLLGLMAQAKPLLVAADPASELAAVIKKVGCGLVSQYGDIGNMEHDLMRCVRDKNLLTGMGQRGAQHVMQYDRKQVLDAWMRRIAGLLPGFNITDLPA